MTDVLTLDLAAGERYADVLTSVATALANDDVETARHWLAPIAGERWVGRVSLASASEQRVPLGRSRTGTASTAAYVYLRDGCVCSYCGGRAVPRCVLVAISDVFPEELPYNAHYAHGEIHPVYWALACEADHTLAHSRGGDDDEGNLTTMHALCNTRKADSLAAADDYTRRESPSSWDGLTSLYPDIVRTGDRHGHRHSSANFHRDWLRRFRTARERI